MNEDHVVIDRHLYLTEDQSRVVEEGDPAGRWLWATPGQQVTRTEAERLGAIKAAPKPTAEAKQEPKPADKASRPPANKARPKPAGK